MRPISAHAWATVDRFTLYSEFPRGSSHSHVTPISVDLCDDSEDLFVASLKMSCGRHDQCFLEM